MSTESELGRLNIKKSMSYIDQLIENCHKAKLAKPIREFTITDISELVDDIPTAIYTIRQTSGSAESAFLKFKEYKKKKERSCSALNKPCEIMYVGSSTTGLKKRLKDHIGSGYKGTYSLHLKFWFTDTFKIRIQEYDLPREIIQIVEDDLSDQLKPAFGKLGANNK